MSVQTRDLDGNLMFFETLQEGYDQARKDFNIWKLSWSGMRWRHEHPSELVKWDSMKSYVKILENCDAYLWVWQDVECNIHDVLTEEQFQKKFNLRNIMPT